MKRSIVYLLTVLFGTLIIHAQTNINSGKSSVFRAGASTSNITPPLGTPIIGNFTEPPAINIHDELHVRCLALDDGTTKLVFVIVDNVGIERMVFDEAKRLINEKTGLPKGNLLMSAVHTHSATSAGGLGEKRRGWNVDEPLDEYQTFVANRISDGVQIALNRLEPARIGWGAGEVPLHLFNRRWMMKKPVMNPFGGIDQVKMNPGIGNPDLLNPAGPIDPEVSFISVQSIAGHPIALLGNYSLHYVGGVPNGDISADYFAVFADRIQELLKADRQDPPFVGILTNGTSGDVNNINFGGKSEKHAPYAKMRIVADDLAQEVIRVYQNIHYHDWVKLQAAESELSLQVRRATPEMLTNIQKVLLRPDTAKPLYNKLEKFYAKRVLQMQKEWPDDVSIILQTFRIGDLGVAAIPFEVFAETGLEIKEKSPFKSTFTIELANGSYGYLPTPEQHKLGGYETWLTTNKVQIDASAKIVEELMSLFSTLK
ncbi:hypothetical protein [Kriegella aquimaris]|uniref:Neutral/alkaline non-lysosomal ceramidase, N-terminal n=1 Tax=Kriegella aquimaris TaxID=192904 RepID=A0A1G9WWH1_9FLAO|nr:hypothetical protein [Kriegella aquimaris]SDM88858.1 hypothetical protein SAMN04488514_11690 [Kriegella aquimaris]